MSYRAKPDRWRTINGNRVPIFDRNADLARAFGLPTMASSAAFGNYSTDPGSAPKKEIQKILDMNVNAAIDHLMKKAADFNLHNIYRPKNREDAIAFLKGCYEGTAFYRNAASVLYSIQYLKNMGEIEDGKVSDLWSEGAGDLTTSSNGIAMISNFEMSIEVLKNWGLGEFDAQGNLLGIYPHYVFKKDGDGNYISDGGITLGYGHWVSKAKYDSNSSEKALIDKYAPNASILPTNIPSNGRAYRVAGSSSVPINIVNELLGTDLQSSQNAVNNFLNSNQIKLNQNQFDALVSFTHQYGENWWTLQPEKVLPKFIREGKGVYDAEKVKETFLLHDYTDRRTIEAQVFISGY